MIKMQGPGGPSGCSQFNCLDRAVVRYIYEVHHPYQEKYDIQYQFCERHKAHAFHNKPWFFPNYRLEDEICQ